MKNSIKKQRRSGKMSKAKGSKFEREVCRKLSMWVSGGKSKSLFWRSSQSGGRATTLRKKGEDLSIQAGDIAAIDPAGKPFTDVFFVECKCLRTLRLDSLVYPVRGVLGPMWGKCVEQAVKYGKTPLMVVKENGRPVLLVMCSGEWSSFLRVIRARFYKQGMFVYLFDDAMKTDPRIFIRGGEETDANPSHGRSTSDRKAKRRLPLGVV